MAGMVKIKVFWYNTQTNANGTTVLEGHDTEILRERFRKTYPNCRIIKTKAVKPQAAQQ